MKVKLKEICDITSGGTPLRSKQEYWKNGTIPWVKIGDIKGKYLDETGECISEEGLNNSSAKYIKKGSILFTIFATLGEVCILDIDATTNQAIAGLTIKDKNVDVNYLYYFLKSLKSYVNDIGRGVAQNNINMSILKEFEIPIQGIQNQKEVSLILDKVSEIIDKRQLQLVCLDNLIKSRFVEMFGDPKDNSQGWPVQKLEKLCKVGSSKRIYQGEQAQEGIPFLRISDLMQRIENGIKSCELYIPQEKYDDLKEGGLVPKPGDILVTSRGTLGECYIVKESDEFYFQDGMISWLYDMNNNVLPLYILYLFKMQGFRKQIDDIQTGTTVAYLSIARLKDLNVMCPPVSMQYEFLDFINQVDKLKVEAQKSLIETQQLFDALMNKYFGS